jgi:hypothetical protein
MYTDKSFICSGCILNPAVDGDPPKSANGRLPGAYTFLYAKGLWK